MFLVVLQAVCAFECDACSALQVHPSYSFSKRSYVVMASNIVPSYCMDDGTVELKVGTSAVVTGHGALNVTGRVLSQIIVSMC